MVRKIANFACLSLLAACGAAQAQPRITSLGQPIIPAGVSSTGGRVLTSTNCGPMTMDLAASVTLTGIANPASTSLGNNCLSSDGQLAWGAVAFPAGSIAGITTTGNTVVGQWSQATNAWVAMPGLPADAATNLKGTGSSGNSSALTQPRGASRNGRYVVGQSYVWANTATTGWVTSGTTFIYRPFLWDTQTNTVKNLPTPPQVNSSNVVIANRYKDGRAICVSNDGSVVMGGYNPNASGGVTGGSAAVWYLQGDGTYLAEVAGQLPMGTDDGSRTVDSFVMNGDGTIIVGTSFDQFDVNGNANPGVYPANVRSYITKWTRSDAASRTWTRTKIYDMSASQSGATPGSISSWWQAYNCSFDPNVVAYPDPRFGAVVGMSDDGNTIVGRLEYSTCGSFVYAGWIWKAGTGPGTGMMDMYDYFVAQNTTDINNSYYGMVGSLANHSGVGLGYPTAISADGNTIVGYGGPNTPLGPGWVVDMTGASTAKAPFLVCSPSNITGFTHCSSPIIQFGSAIGGSGTLTYSWMKGTPGSGVQLNNGDQASPAASGIGSNITGANTFLLRVNYPNLSDAGSYYLSVSSSNGGSVDSAAATATAAGTAALPNDLCMNAVDILLGANATDTTQEKTYDACTAYIDEFRSGQSCYTNISSADAWYKYTPTATGSIRIENCASTVGTGVITVYDSCGGTELACSGTSNSSSSSSTLPSCSRNRINRFDVTENVPIYIRAGSQGNPSSGLGKIRIYPAPATPTNDGCASPATAVLGANAFDTSESGYDASEIVNGGLVSCSTVASRDVWFVHTPAVKGTYIASTCYNAADVNTPLTTPNTVLTAFEAACGGTEIVCNDNSTRGTCGATTGTLTTAVNTSQISVGVRNAGQSFWVRVGGNSATSTAAIGPGTLTIRFTPVKCNAADVAQLGGTLGFDGQNTVDDLVAFLAQFFANNLAVADITNLGGSGGPDGQVTVDDLTYYLAQFFSPCN